MQQTERLYAIERMIRNRGHVSFAQMRDALEVSAATLKRDLQFLRDRLGAPIEYDRSVNGYRFSEQAPVGEAYQLPGLWFNERELYSLLMAHQLLSGIDRDGVISRHLQPLLDRIHQLLADGDQGGAADAQMLVQRVRLITPAERPVTPIAFERVAEALMRRRRLAMRYATRGRGGSISEREVSPQRLVHYRHTWYLDAWCHTRERLSRFALDAIEHAGALPEAALEMPIAQVQARMDAGYGIYAGATPQWALLRFDAQAAQWVSREQWHPQQRARWLDDGSYEVQVPYVDETELAMDVLRHGEQVQVLAPPTLVQVVAQRLRQAVARYEEQQSPKA